MRGTVRRDADINWTVADVCSDDWDGGLRSGAFAVLDKGTSDAVMSDKRSARQRMAQLRERIVRALRPSGRWLVVSHSPPHLRLEHLCPRIAQTREAENFDLHRATAAATKAQATAAIRAAMASATEREPVVAETGREGGGVAPPLDGHPLLHLSGSSLEDSPWSAVQVSDKAAPSSNLANFCAPGIRYGCYAIDLLVRVGAQTWCPAALHRGIDEGREVLVKRWSPLHFRLHRGDALRDTWVQSDFKHRTARQISELIGSVLNPDQAVHLKPQVS